MSARVVAALLLFALGACTQRAPERPEVKGADTDRGNRLLSSFGCIACHHIPGVPGRTDPIGPPLAAFAQRAYIAGRLPNTFENLQLWILEPQEVDPGNAMPDLGVNPDEARDMAAYLYSLE